MSTRTPSGPTTAILLVWFSVLAGTAFPTRAQSFEAWPQDVTGFIAASLSWGDYDGDGDLDLLIGGGATTGHQTLLYRNDAGTLVPGPFTAISGFTGSTAWGDFDGDGDLDFAAGGFSRFPDGEIFPPLSARIFRNDGPGGFTALGTEIATSGVVIWADFDRDGDLDLLVAGADLGEPQSADLDLRRIRIYVNEPGQPWRIGFDHPLPSNSRIPLVEDWDKDGWPDIVYAYNRGDDSKGLVFLRNEGGLRFTQSESDFSGYAWPYFMDWGDFDNDGDLDAAFSGELSASRVLRLVRHDEATNTSFDVPGLGGLAIAWADFDNDGRLDLSTTDGSDGDLGSFLRLHRNTALEGDPTFDVRDLPFRGAGYSSLSWVDLDSDGDLDLAVTGFTNQVPSFRLLRNLAPVPNPPPSMPGSLTSTVGPGGSVELRWSESLDANQPGGLTYNVRVGHGPLSADVVSPGANATTGKLLAPARGNASTLRHMPLTNLTAGTYRWSVQAVDNGFASSPFAAEAEFVIPPGVPRIRNSVSSDIRYQHALVAAEALADGSPTTVWFEYGPTAAYGSQTPAQNLGSGVSWIALAQDLTALETELTYHWRLVASNAVGVTQGPDLTFRIANTPPGFTVASRIVTGPDRPTEAVPIVLSDVETAAADLVLKVVPTPGQRQNPKLVTAAGIQLGGAGANRTLIVTPEKDQHGSIILSITVTDAHGASATRTVEFRVEDYSRFKLVSTSLGTRAAWIDVDGDDWLDLVGGLKWFYNERGTNLTDRTGSIANAVSGVVAPADVDRDGRVDFAVAGIRSGQSATVVYTNRPFVAASTHQFRSLPATLSPGVRDGTIAWADFDGDGDSDLMTLGLTNVQPATAFTTQVWRQDPGPTFTAVTTGIGRFALGGMAWADYDGDGDLDVCVTGTTNRASSGAYTILYRNDGSGSFTDTGVVLPPLYRSFVDWGDVDNDGRPDLLLGGFERFANNRTTNHFGVFRQTASGAFEELQRLEPLVDAQGQFADVDNDGRLDVIYLGADTGLGVSTWLKVYLQRDGGFIDVSPLDTSTGDAPAIGDFDGDGDLDVLTGQTLMRNNWLSANPTPAAPAGLAADIAGDRVTFRWQPALDPNQTGGHTYNLRVGTSPGGVDVMSPMSNPSTGRRWAVGIGNASSSLLWHLGPLAPGKYYWSVQAVDHSFAGGAFAAEQSFTIGAAAPEFTGAILTDGGTLTLHLSVPAAGRYVLEASDDLVNWSPIADLDLVAGAQSRETPVQGEPQRFFRLR